MMRFIRDDGGRKAAGFKGTTGDCVARAVAIATQQDYLTVYEQLSEGCRTERTSRLSARARQRKDTRSARDGVHVKRKWFKDYMTRLGWVWVPTMGIGTGCRVHLNEKELPLGRLIVSVSKHYTAVIDHVIRDMHDPQRQSSPIFGSEIALDGAGNRRNVIVGWTGERCVYGYWRPK